MKGIIQAMFRIAFSIFFSPASTCFPHFACGCLDHLGWQNSESGSPGQAYKCHFNVLYMGIRSPHITDNIAPGEDVFFYDILQCGSFSI